MSRDGALRALAWSCVAATLLSLAQPAASERFMSYYGVNITAQVDWLTLGIGAATDLDEYRSASNGRIRGLVRMSETGVYDRGNHSALEPGWETVLANWAAQEVAPRLANGTARGVFLGDEICCHDVPCWSATMEPLTKRLRALLGPDAILYENDCGDSFTGLKSIPEELDIISFDIYVGYSPAPKNNGTAEAVAARSYAETHLYPLLGPHQSIAAVPGTFACSNLTYMPLEESAASVVEKLDAYWQWMKEDARLVMLNPWHFNFRGHPQHAPPCDMQLGAADMPSVLAKLDEIGKWIIANNTAVEKRGE